MQAIKRCRQHSAAFLGRVYDVEALGLGGGKGVVGLRDGVEKGVAGGFDAVGGLVALSQSLLARRRVDSQKQGAIGLQTAGGEIVDCADLLQAQPPTAALISQRRIDKTIEQQPRAVRQRRTHTLSHQLGTSRGIKQSLRARVYKEIRVLDDGPQSLGQHHSPRLAQDFDWLTALAQGPGKAFHQRRLACAVQSFHSDQPTGHARDRI